MLRHLKFDKVYSDLPFNFLVGVKCGGQNNYLFLYLCRALNNLYYIKTIAHTQIYILSFCSHLSLKKVAIPSLHLLQAQCSLHRLSKSKK